MKATEVLVVKTMTASPSGVIRLLLDEEITRVIESGCLNVVTVVPQEQEVICWTNDKAVESYLSKFKQDEVFDVTADFMND
jgi:hypothetical protein